MTRVLIVDADAQAAELLATLLRLSDPSIGTALAHSARSALLFATDLHLDVAIINMDSQAMRGEAIGSDILTASSGHRPVLIGLYERHTKAAETSQGSIFDHALTKPQELPSLLRLIRGLPTQVTT
jgi:DNA-binding NtrC family response regulator